MLRVAVLGAGRIGKIHAANVAGNPKAKLVTIADPYGTAARDLADHLDCEASLDPIAAIERADVDAIIVGTPTDTHVSSTLHAVKMGKAVLCEKPIDLDLAKVDAAVREIERLNGRVMVAFNRRFDPSARQLRRSIDAGEIGDVRQVIITSRDPGMPPHDYVAHSGGIFRDMVIHDFDMARSAACEEPTEVMATASRACRSGTGEVRDFDTLTVTTAARLRAGNAISTAAASQLRLRSADLEIFGSTGMLLNENLRPTTVRRWSKTETEVRDPLLNFFLERYADAYKAELNQFVDALENGAPMPTTPHDGRQALRLADCALELRS